MKKILLLIIAIFFVTGCYDYNELTDLGIISTLLVDYDYNEKEYNLSLEILETNEKVSEPSYFLTGKGRTFELALTDAYNKSPKHIYINHLSMVIMATKLENEQLKDIYNYFTANTKVNKETYFILSSDIKSLEEIKTKDKTSLGENIKNIIYYNKLENAQKKTSKFSDILHLYLNDEIYFLGSIKVEDENIILGETYALKRDKEKIEIDEKYVLLANMLDNSISSFNIDSNESYQVYNSKSSINVKNDKIIINLKTDVRLLAPPTYDINDENSIVKESAKLQNYLKNKIEEGINYSKSIDLDIYNFDYLYYQKKKENYYKGIWKNITYEVNVKVNLNEKGIILNRMDDDNEK